MDILIAIMASALAGGGSAVGSAPADAPAATARFPTVTDKQLDQMVGELGHPRFAVRETATQRLCMLDSRYLPELARRYRGETGYEMKRRIRYVVESIFYRDQIAGREGFLGISIAKRVDTSATDPATGGRTRGVVIVKILEGLPAERAGLQVNDVVISVDGAALPNEPSSQGFISMISSRCPGSEVRMRVLRPARSPRRVMVPFSGDPTRPIDGVKFEPLPLGIAVGPRIVGRAPDSAAAGLAVNEIIDSINGKSLAGARGSLTPENALRAAKPGDILTLGVLAVEETGLKVVLGARPAKYLEATDKTEARRRFLRWWQDQGGELLLLCPPKPRTANMPVSSGKLTPAVPEISVIP